MTAARRVFVIGLDGATFDVIEPFAAAGRLPALAGLLAASVHGPLRSTVPPMTYPGWSSLMTGQNPGKHGIYGFSERRPGSYEIRFVNARHRRSPTIWRLLSEAGRRVSVVGLPAMYPPEPVNGIVISGFDALAADETAMYPPALYQELRRAVGDYVLAPDIVRLIDEDRVDEALEVMLRSIRVQADAAEYLLKRDRWDVFMLVFCQTDKAAHHFWRFHLARLLAEGAHGPLRATLPPMTFPSWTSFMTGKNPGKHGIFDFTERPGHGYEVRIVNARQRRAETIWTVLSRAGKRVAAVGVPVTYPPEAVNGVMISGFDAPVQDARIAWPPTLFDELKARVGGYIVSADFANLLSRGDVERALEALLAVVDRKAATARYLLEREPWDCFMVVFGETDACAHYFWKYHDPRSPHRLPGDRRPAVDPILQVYRRVDEVLGELLARVPGDTVVVLVSDHGTGGGGDKIIHLNRLWFGEAAVGARLESRLRFAGIDWPRTLAFSEETTYYPTVWINLKGREPLGVVGPGAEYEAVRDRLRQLLLRWRDPHTGEPVVRGVHRREELYHGPHVDRAPDLVVDWNLDRGYSYLSRSSYLSPARRPIEQVGHRAIRSSAFMLNRSGSHRDDGIVLLRGGPVRRNHAIAGAAIVNIAPTLLYLLGVPVPDDMDGRVLGEAFETGHYAAHPPDVRPARPATVPAGAAGEGTADESRWVEDRLRGLGYLE